LLTVLIVDDEPDVRFLISRLVEGLGELSLVGEAASGQEAITCWRDLRPEVIVLDQRMPGLSGLETAERILAEDPDQRIVLFTAFLDPALTQAATQLGVQRCLAKSDLNRLTTELLTQNT